MNVNLSWDLFVIVMFVVIMAYSLIMGRDSTLKVILGTYISAFAADALGNLFESYFANSAFFNNILGMLSVTSSADAIVLVKIMTFVLLVILFAVRGAFEIHTYEDNSSAVKLVIDFTYAFLSAALIVTCILTFVAGNTFVGERSQPLSLALFNIINSSKMIAKIISHSYMLFALPAVAFLVHSLYSRKSSA